MSWEDQFEEAGTRFWGAAKALLTLKNVGLLDAAADAMKQQAREFAAGINGPHTGCMCEHCVLLRERIAAQEAEGAQLAIAPDPTDAW